MAITTNPTLPQEWDSSKDYYIKQQVLYKQIIYQCVKNTGGNHMPPYNKSEYWIAIDAYKKAATVMPHGPYAGDDEFWERDEVKITPTGDVLINNEVTGINVRGPRGDGTIRWENLTPQQRDSLKGDQGPQGKTGPKGDTGERGPAGYIDLSPEQIEILKGETGKSNYELWLEMGHTGDLNDYFAWLIHSAVIIDTKLSEFSSNPVENRAISAALEVYKSLVNELLHQYEARLQALENRLKARYNNEDHYFSFGVTTEGKYGYYYGNTTPQLIPFDNTNSEVLNTMMTEELQGVAAQSFANNNSTLAYSTIADHSPYSPTSLEGDVTSSGGEDNMPLYGTNIESINLTDYIDHNIEYTEIFKQGQGFLESQPIYTYGFDGMTLSNNQLITNNSTSPINGIYFNTELGQAYSRIYFVVEPLTIGENITCQYGSINKTYESLHQAKEFINGSRTQENAGIVRYKNDSFDERQTFFVNISGNEGCYFCAKDNGDFKIIKMYCC